MDKTDFKFANRFDIALLMACKSCMYCKLPDLKYVVGNMPNEKGDFCNLSFDTKVKLVLKYRQDCNYFQDEDVIERDTTYPGATYAPTDNNHNDILPDSTDIDFNPYAAKRCLNQASAAPYIPRVNNWEPCLSLIFDRKRCDWDKKDAAGNNIPLTFEEQFPSPSEVMRLLNTSSIPQFTFRLGLPPQRSMGFDRGLWFYRSEKFNSQIVVTEDMKPEARKMAQKNSEIKAEMKKLMMVYLYHCWFKKLDNEKKIGYYMALDASNKFSLGKDLSWWMLTVFKDETALLVYPPEDELELEFIPISLLNKAQEAVLLAAVDCNSTTELDIEAKEYDEMLSRLGYNETWDGITDKEGHEILY